jgi:hypothetical protein
MRGDGLPQFLVVEPRQEAEEQRAVHARGAALVRAYVLAATLK